MGLHEPQFVPHFNASPSSATELQPSSMACVMVFSRTSKQLQTTSPFKNASSTWPRIKLRCMSVEIDVLRRLASHSLGTDHVLFECGAACAVVCAVAGALSPFSGSSPKNAAKQRVSSTSARHTEYV